MIDCIDQRGDAERIGKKDKFLAHVAAHLSCRREELHASHPFRFARLDLTDKGVQMTDQCLHDLLSPYLWSLFQRIQDEVSNFVLGQVIR